MLQVLLCLKTTSWPAQLVCDHVHIPGNMCGNWRIKIYTNFSCQGFSISGLYIPLHRVLGGMNKYSVILIDIRD